VASAPACAAAPPSVLIPAAGQGRLRARWLHVRGSLRGRGGRGVDRQCRRGMGMGAGIPARGRCADRRCVRAPPERLQARGGGGGAPREPVGLRVTRPSGGTRGGRQRRRGLAVRGAPCGPLQAGAGAGGPWPATGRGRENAPGGLRGAGRHAPRRRGQQRRPGAAACGALARCAGAGTLGGVLGLPWEGNQDSRRDGRAFWEASLGLP